jgi:TRAP-type C4-dicarboxylate transport system permease small subunit
MTTETRKFQGQPAGTALPLTLLHTLDRGIAQFEALVLAYGILLMALNTIANVIGRQIFGQSLYFSEELNQFLIVLVTFVGIGYAARRGRHIRMSAFYDQLADGPKKILMITICAGTALVMFIMAYYAVVYVVSVARLGKVTPALQVPVYLTYLWVPLGFVITGIQYALTIVRNLREEPVFLSYEQVDQYDETDYSQDATKA